MKMNAKDIASLWHYVREIQWNPVNVNTRGTCHSVHYLGIYVKQEIMSQTKFIEIKDYADQETRIEEG